VYLKTLGDVWNKFGENDPMWAVLMDPARKGNRWNKSEFFATGREDVQYAMQMIGDLRFPLRHGRALDFGCAIGRLTQGLAGYFDEVHGVDIAPAMILRARASNPYGERCRFHVNQRSDLKMFADGQFDFVLSLLVLQHMRPALAKSYLAEFMRVLAPGGLLLFQQPTGYSRAKLAGAIEPPQWYEPAPGIERLINKVQDRFCAPLPPVPWATSYERAQVTRARYPYLPPLDAEDMYTRVDPAERSTPAGRPSRPPEVMNDTRPEVELHTIPRWKTVAHLRRLGGRVIGIQSRNECSPHHPSLRYFVTR
jgi:SAM-dependent methyltransferase